MKPPKIRQKADGTLLVERFTPIRRAEHLLVIATFVVLLLTGFPQKFPDVGVSRWVIDTLGGLGATRTIHRAAGLVFAAHAVIHLLALAIGAATRKLRLSLLPVPQDLRDAWENLRYYLGHRAEPPELPKFDYRHKFEYIGIVMGGLVMVVSGLILLFPVKTAGIMPGEVIPAAHVAHSNEALLAFLVLLIWHLYGSHLSPDVFPMDKTIFTGYMPIEDLEHHHKKEYRRLFPNGVEIVGQARAPQTDGDAPDEPVRDDVPPPPPV